MSTPAKRRLIRDFRRLTTDPPGGVSAAPNPDNLMMWDGVIYGPADTPFEDGTFKLQLEFDDSYPSKPPKNRWSPTYDVAAILTSVQSLLGDPNPASPANAEAAQLFRDDFQKYLARVAHAVEESWFDDQASRRGIRDQVYKDE